MARYLNLPDLNPRKITKHDKNLANRLDFKDIKFPVKIRDIHKIGKNNSIVISVFGYESNEKHPIYVWKKYCEEKYIDLLLIGERGKHNVFFEDSNTFMYNYSLHPGKKPFSRYCLQAYVTEKVLKVKSKIALKLMVNKELKCLKKVNKLNWKILKEK